MQDKVLDQFVKSGLLKDYQYQTLDEEGNIVSSDAGFRNTQQLILTFSTGEVLVIDTFCSGSAENTYLLLESPQVST